MYIIICTIYTTVQRKQTYTITIQNVYNYMYNIYNGTEKTNIYNNNNKCIWLYVQYIQRYREDKHIQWQYKMYIIICTIYTTEKTNIYNNNAKCI